MIRAVLLASVLFLGTCTPAPGPRPLPQPDAADTGAPRAVDAAEGPVDCSACSSPVACACCILTMFHCPEARPTPHGITCPEYFATIPRVPGRVPYALCVANATSLAEIRLTCGVSCQ